MKVLKVIQIIFVLVLLTSYSFAQETGKIRGTVYEESGETAPGVNVVIEGTNPPIGASTDFDGKYTITGVKPGTYTLVVSAIMYDPIKLENIVVKAGGIAIKDVTMKQGTIMLEGAVVEAKRVSAAKIAIINDIKNTDGIAAGMGQEEMKEVNATTGDDVVKRISGGSTQDGTPVFRGTGDRYTNAQINGTNMVSTDPNSNAVDLRLVPSNLLENIIVSKTFTPDQPGSFTGGNVNLKTKSFPEKLTISYSMSASYNDQSSLNDGFLTQKGGKRDWLGYDDGSRDVPEVLQDTAYTNAMVKSLAIKARRDDSLADILDKTSKALNTQMEPTKKKSPVNHGVAFSIGNQKELTPKKDYVTPIGYLVGVNYRRNYTFYEDGVFAGWQLNSKEATELNNQLQMQDTKAVESPTLGGLANLAIKPTKNTEIGVNVLYNHNSTLTSQSQTGSYPGVISASQNTFNTHSIMFREKQLSTYQLYGKHHFDSLNHTQVEWMVNTSNSYQKEPDLRLFANDQSDDTTYFVSPSEYDLPFHFFRDLKDKQNQAKLDITVPVLNKWKKKNKSKDNIIKFGGYYSNKKRTFTENRFQMQLPKAGEVYAGNPELYFSPDNVGIIGYDSTRNRNMVGVYATDETRPQNNYSGTEEIIAGYLMESISFTNRFRVTGGARFENTNMHVASQDSSLDQGDISIFDLLPSINMVYGLDSTGEKMKIRASYTNTIARPNMRELAPFTSFDFIGGFIYVGNPNLQRTRVENFDLRWELYSAIGEMIAISTYYKKFSNPIVKTFSPKASNPEIIFQNTADAYVYGVELELQKNLSFISDSTNKFQLNSNLTLIKSQVAIRPDEYAIISEINPALGSNRPFQGQSPFIFNANLSYKNDNTGWASAVTFNIFGSRLAAVSLSGTPDIYEQPRNMLDFNIGKSFGKDKAYAIKFVAKNILNAKYTKSMFYQGNEYVQQSYQLGRTYGLKLSYTL